MSRILTQIRQLDELKHAVAGKVTVLQIKHNLFRIESAASLVKTETLLCDLGVGQVPVIHHVFVLVQGEFESVQG